MTGFVLYILVSLYLGLETYSQARDDQEPKELAKIFAAIAATLWPLLIPVLFLEWAVNSLKK